MFAILENGSVETMLRYRLRFSTGRAFAIPTGQSKTRMTVMTLRSCARTFIAGRTMSIIESSLVLWRLVARAKQSALSGGNGRRVISVDRPQLSGNAEIRVQHPHPESPRHRRVPICSAAQARYGDTLVAFAGSAVG